MYTEVAEKRTGNPRRNCALGMLKPNDRDRDAERLEHKRARKRETWAPLMW